MTNIITKFIPKPFDKQQSSLNQNYSPALQRALAAIGPAPKKKVELHVLPPETALYMVEGILAAAMIQVNQVTTVLGLIGEQEQAQKTHNIETIGKKIAADIHALAASITPPPPTDYAA